MRGELKCCAHIRGGYIYIFNNNNNKKTHLETTEALREMSIHISMWLCCYNTEGKCLLLSILTLTSVIGVFFFSFQFAYSITFFWIKVAPTKLSPHSPGWLFRSPLMGTSETSLSNHTSSRSCPCSQFARCQELEGGRVDWENKKKMKYVCWTVLLNDCKLVCVVFCLF